MEWFLPVVSAFVISYCTSMVGVSGAFLLLPIQISVLGLTSPAVSATNLVFNLIAIPSGIYRYWRERRILWPLALIIIVGTAPGVVLGGFIRLSVLADVQRFKVFVACVLLWIGQRLLRDIWKSRKRTEPLIPQATGTSTLAFSLRTLVYEFQGQHYECAPLGIFCLSLVVGLIGGIYGIGGGAIIAPFLVAIYGLPIHTVAGATLTGTFATSIVGVGFYQLISPAYHASGVAVAPDWNLGLRFGIGGIAGMYLGARTQRYVRAIYLKILLTLILFGLSASYLWGFLGHTQNKSLYLGAAALIVLAIFIWAKRSGLREQSAAIRREQPEHTRRS